MDKKHYKHIIIGAGLSGLTTAYKLWESGETDFCVLESRDRIGGRISTKNGIDFGATWFHKHHEAVHQLLDGLNLDRFPQFSSGKSILVYSSMAPAHEFESDPKTPSPSRIVGGTQSLIDGLAVRFRESILTSTKVSKIAASHTEVAVQTSQGEFTAKKVINTIPPRLSTGITFTPELPEALQKAMTNTHTWMSNAIKVGLTFKRPFWRENGFSGMMIGQIGAVTELYDHTNVEESHFAFMGFVNEGLRDLSPVDRKERILSYIETYLGSQVRDYVSYEEKDWYENRNTSCEQLKSVYISPQYGNPIFQEVFMNGKLRFSGAETAQVHGGYMDGAIQAGIKSAAWLLSTSHKES